MCWQDRVIKHDKQARLARKHAQTNIQPVMNCNCLVCSEEKD